MRWQTVTCLLFAVVLAAFLLSPLAQVTATRRAAAAAAAASRGSRSTPKGSCSSASSTTRRPPNAPPRPRTLNRNVARTSRLRKVSLNRLEAALQANNGVLTDEMRHLAGLLRARYVFYYPETKDIVIAGPAEGWMANPSGRVVGINSGRPVLQLQDLVVALRTFGRGNRGRR